MFTKRRRTSSAFGPDGRRLGDSTAFGSNVVNAAQPRKQPFPVPNQSKCLGTSSSSTQNKNSNCSSSSCGDGRSRTVATLGSRKKVHIQRVPIINGLSVGSSGLFKPFQRPKIGRRAYKGQENEALKRASLGPRRSTGGMERLLSRAGKGLHFLSRRPAQNSSGTDDSSGDEDEEEEERPFEPLMLWQSPHQGGEVKGLPPSMYVPWN